MDKFHYAWGVLIILLSIIIVIICSYQAADKDESSDVYNSFVACAWLGGGIVVIELINIISMRYFS